MTETLEQLEKMEKIGLKMFGEFFKDTLAWVQIQRKKREILVEAGLSHSEQI